MLFYLTFAFQMLLSHIFSAIACTNGLLPVQGLLCSLQWSQTPVESSSHLRFPLHRTTVTGEKWVLQVGGFTLSPGQLQQGAVVPKGQGYILLAV